MPETVFVHEQRDDGHDVRDARGPGRGDDLLQQDHPGSSGTKSDSRELSFHWKLLQSILAVERSFDGLIRALKSNNLTQII